MSSPTLDPSRIDPEEVREFMQAIRKGDLSTVQAMVLKHDALTTSKLEDGDGPLHYAAEEGNIPIAEFLIEHGADVSVSESFGWTPLHCAVYWKRLQCAEFLIQKGAPLNAVSTKEWVSFEKVLVPAGITPIQLAELFQNQEMMQLLKRYTS